mgnify:CR=1 FL=1|jgi:hypothetical protein
MASGKMRRWSELPLRRRIAHCFLFLGVPHAVWEVWDIFHEPVIEPSLKTVQLGSGILFALLHGFLTAFIAGLLEHGLFLVLRKKGGNQ